jgi:choline dehydrogenase
MQHNGRRISAWKLLQLALNATTPKDSHLFSCLHAAYVRSVEFDRDRAVGVRIMSHGKERVIQAHRGVILSAGTFGTPRVLFASGIGSRDEFQAIDVPHRFESPRLGKNLQDHLVLPMVYRLKCGTTVSHPPNREDRLTYLQNRKGPRASNLAELGGFFNSLADTASIASSREPFDFQWHITPTHYLEYPNLVSHTPHLSFGLTHVAPKSRGFVKPIRASDSNDHEVALHIDPGYLSDPGDLSGWLQGISRTRELLQGDGWCDWLAEESLPGARRSDAKVLELFVRRFATTIYHYAGTCSLGITNRDALDEQFRVRGIDGLWVCDASAMPTLVRCNPQATIMMMAWRLADWLP